MIEPVLDVSHWQGTIDWPKAKAAGAKAIILRAGSVARDTGELYKDRQWDRNSALAPALFPCGSYWFFRTQHSAIEQARYYANLLAGKTLLLPPALDFETNDTGLSRTVCQARAKAFLEELELKTGVRPIIYTSASKWNTYCGRTGWAAQYKLWVAHYTTAPQPYLPWDWESVGYEVWQYTSKGPGKTYGMESEGLDMNRAKDSFLAPTLPMPADALDRLWSAAIKHGWEL